ncbi:MAG: potassium channel family protein [bacterium]
MNVIVVGCGRFGAALAYRLFKSGNNVSIVDKNPNAFENLPPDFVGLIVEGDALSQDVLLRAGIEKADSLALATNSDTTNVVVAHTARVAFGVPNVVVRNYDPRYRPLYDEFKLQTVSSVLWGVQRMEEAILYPGMEVSFTFGAGEVKMYEVVIPKHWQGKKIRELSSKDCIPVVLIRNGCSFIPEQETILEEGDVLQVSATAKGRLNLLAQLSSDIKGG